MGGGGRSSIRVWFLSVVVNGEIQETTQHTAKVYAMCGLVDMDGRVVVERGRDNVTEQNRRRGRRKTNNREDDGAEKDKTLSDLLRSLFSLSVCLSHARAHTHTLTHAHTHAHTHRYTVCASLLPLYSASASASPPCCGSGSVAMRRLQSRTSLSSLKRR